MTSLLSKLPFGIGNKMGHAKTTTTTTITNVPGQVGVMGFDNGMGMNYGMDGMGVTQVTTQTSGIGYNQAVPNLGVHSVGVPGVVMTPTTPVNYNQGFGVFNSNLDDGVKIRSVAKSDGLNNKVVKTEVQSLSTTPSSLGFNQGFDQVNLNQGYNQGYNQGFSHGMSQGFNQGYSQGVSQGMNQGLYNSTSGVTTSGIGLSNSGIGLSNSGIGVMNSGIGVRQQIPAVAVAPVTTTTTFNSIAPVSLMPTPLGFTKDQIDQYAYTSFYKFDTNRSNSLGLDEVIAAFTEFAMLSRIGKFNPEEIRNIALRFDFDRNGVLSLQEYVMMLEVLSGIRPMAGYQKQVNFTTGRFL